MFRTLLATIILTIFLFFPQALSANDTRQSYCLPPDAMHKQLLLRQLFLFTYGVTNNGFLIAIYINPDSGFVVVAESGEIACILTDGTTLYTSKTKGI